MAGIKIIKDSYKALYIKFVWQICLFLLTLNIAASIFQAIETKDGAQSSEPTKTDIISNFSNTHNVSSEEILKLFKRLEDFTHITDHSMTYSEGLVLTLSLFYTIGKFISPKQPHTQGYLCNQKTKGGIIVGNFNETLGSRDFNIKNLFTGI